MCGSQHTNKPWKILKEIGLPDHLTYLLRNLYEGQEATVRTGHEQWTDFKSGKEYVKIVYCHLAYLTYMQNTATAKSLQSCLTLCDPIPGILQARTLEWVAISFSNA